MRFALSNDLSELTTERLVLAAWTAEAVTAVLAAADAHAGGKAEHRPADWAADFPADGDCVIAQLLGGNPDWLGAYGHRLIIERCTGLVVGSIGLFWPPSEGVLELGYGVVASRQGRGYATEAATALAAFALSAPGVKSVVAGVELSNPASVRVLEKAGFERFETTHAEDGGELARYRMTAAPEHRQP
ncbi:GNAT family N-acetyltransferase [Streptomyces sp. NPDC031705]|uniref:GNAT family N-acetyltransferase n=1 Tax=Streptomyces sp. NPDC031705 TaxID=3155729 RepID=UPI0033FDAC2F